MWLGVTFEDTESISCDLIRAEIAAGEYDLVLEAGGVEVVVI